MVSTQDVIATVACCTIETLDKTQSNELVAPQLPSKTATLALVSARNHDAVPDAAQSESAVIVFAVATPATAAPNAVAPNVQVASRVCVVMAVSGVAGWVPV